MTIQSSIDTAGMQRQMHKHAPHVRTRQYSGTNSAEYAGNSGLLTMIAAREPLRAIRRPITGTVRVAAGAVMLCAIVCCNTAIAQTPKPPVRVVQRETPASREADAPRAPQRPAGQAGQAAQNGRAVQAGAAPNVARPPQVQHAPFKLTAKQQADLDQLLDAWEKHSSKIDTFKCRFKRWDYDETFGSKKEGWLNTEVVGEIKYRSPDHGKFIVTEMKRQWNDAKKQFEPPAKDQVLEHWVCDGKAIYEFDTAKRQLIERRLPAELQGKSIVDGPLPFIFNAKAATLKSRYFLRDITPKEQFGKQIWLDAYPKRADDARNFSHVELILTEADYNPYALQIYLPNGTNRQVYAFEKILINDKLGWLKMDFASPSPPFGWKRVVEPAPGGDPPTEQKGTAGKGKPVVDPKQARKPAGDRK